MIPHVLANDSDVDGTLTAASIATFSRPNGTVVNTATGPSPTPDGDTTADSFTYTMDDGSGATATATVNVTVNAVNDAPVAVADAATVSEGGSVTTVNVLANDSDVDGTLTAASVAAQPGANGSVVNNADGTFTYTPAGHQRHRQLHLHG